VADHSKIEWTDATLNIVTGCTRVSEGCDHCYIERTPALRMASRKFDGQGPGSTTGVQLHPERLAQALRWRRPRRIFMPSLSDLFHEAVPDELLVQAFAVMAVTPRHTWQITTKRPARMRSLLADAEFWSEVAQDVVGMNVVDGVPEVPLADDGSWYPLPNVWLGVSVENQRWADIRVPLLLNTPAAVRWLSCEPLLGPVDLNRYLRPRRCSQCGQAWTEWACGPTHALLACDPGLHWVVVGGESGPGARPMHPAWARSLRDQCATAGTPFFFKQWGEWAPSTAGDARGTHVVELGGPCHGRLGEAPAAIAARGAHIVARPGKKATGRELDGRTHDAYPAEVRAAAEVQR